MKNETFVMSSEKYKFKTPSLSLVGSLTQLQTAHTRNPTRKKLKQKQKQISLKTSKLLANFIHLSLYISSSFSLLTF